MQCILKTGKLSSNDLIVAGKKKIFQLFYHVELVTHIRTVRGNISKGIFLYIQKLEKLRK